MASHPVSLRVRLVGLILLATLPVMAVAITGPAWLAARNLRGAAERELAAVAKGVADNVGWWDDTVVLTIKTLARNPDISGMEPASQRAVLQRVAAVQQRFYLLGVTDLTGRNTARSDDEPLKDYHDRDWFIQASAGRSVARQAVVSRTTNLPGVIVAVPVRDASQNVIGVAMGGMSLASLSQQVGAIKVGRTGFVFVVDEHGMVMAHPDLGPASELRDYSALPPVRELLANKAGGAFAFTDRDGVRWLSRSTLAPNGWGVVSLQAEAEVLAAARRIEWWAWGATVIAALVATGLAWVLASRVARPVLDITRSAVALAAGRWDVPVPETRRDEIGTLAHAFNEMAANLARGYRQIEERVEQRTAELRQSNAELRTAREAADAANRAKDEFLANMSHELRTPLSTILGYTDLLNEPARGPATRDAHLSVVRASARHLLAIITDMLDLSRIEAGRVTPDVRAVDVDPLLGEVVDGLRPRAEAKGLTLRVTRADGVPGTIRSDPTRLRQILINLVGNAVKFTERGGVSIHVSILKAPTTGHDADDAAGNRKPPPAPKAIAGSAPPARMGGHATDDPRDGRAPRAGAAYLRFDVTDTGIGLAPAQVEGLFQRFAQVDASASRRYGGTGLGLVISRHLARILGGDIVVTSEAGRGSTFTLTVATDDGVATLGDDAAPMPALRTGASGDTSTDAASDDRSIPIDAIELAVGVAAIESPTVDSPLNGLRVLLAEDVPVNQLLFVTILQRSGATVTPADNGREAIDRFNDAASVGAPFDVVLMDMQMPEVDGYEATAHLRRAGVTLPIIALTAHARDVDRDRCLAAGCTDFATKPVDRDALVAMILHHVRERAPLG